MDGVAAVSDEFKYLAAPGISTRDFRSKMWNQVELAEAHDIGDVQAAKFFVVGDVQENSVRVRLRRHACASFPVRASLQVSLSDEKVVP